MRRIAYILTVTISLFIGTMNALAGDHPEAHFGKYGIQHYPYMSDYQQYVGQTVAYYPAGITGTRRDEVFLDNKGVYKKPYVITKITGSNQRMTFHLKEKDGNTKVKLIVNNQDEYEYFGSYTFCITDDYSIPLLLIDKFNTDKENYKGKVYPQNTDSEVSMEVKDLVIRESISYGEYPTISLILKDKSTQKEYDADCNADLSLIGKEFTRPQFYKCKYHVISVLQGINKYTNNPEIHYIVKNNMDGRTKEVAAKDAQLYAFYDDSSGSFATTLTKVEKTNNSDINNGRIKTVSEKDSKYEYNDDVIDITISTNNREFSFILKNVSDNTIKLNWNEAVFVDINGSTSKIMHTGVRYSDRDSDQPASTIIKGAKLDDVALPTDRAYYDDDLRSWTSKSLFLNAKKDENNQTIRLMLPIQVKDENIEYIFEFEVYFKYDHPEYLI